MPQFVPHPAQAEGGLKRGTVTKKFRRRVLIVDDDGKVLKSCSLALRRQGYEVLTAGDGFEALQVLRGAVPDLMIVELNLPRMSGFELLAVVRKRFPEMGVIATSGEYNAVTLPPGTIADAFVAKEPNATFEVVEAAIGLIKESPIRSSRAKSALAPVWVPRSTTRYIVLTCPECLRSFSAPQPRGDCGEPCKEMCLFCGAKVRFGLSSSEVVEPPEQQPREARARDRIKRSRKNISDSQNALASSRALIDSIKR